MRGVFDGRQCVWGSSLLNAAVRSFTSWNAYASFQEGDLGSLERGKRADLVVLSEDVFLCPEERIKDIVPVLTMVGGEVAWARPEAG